MIIHIWDNSYLGLDYLFKCMLVRFVLMVLFVSQAWAADWSLVDAAVKDAIANGAFPGAVVAVSN